VVISGDGGDEIFGGYERFSTARRIARLGQIPMAPRVVSSLGTLLGRRKPDLARQLGKAAAFSQASPTAQLCALHTYLSASEVGQLLDPGLHSKALAEGTTYERFARAIPNDSCDPAERMMIAEIRTTLHADSTRKVDIASSAHGLEVRTPYLDPAVLDLAMRLPMRLKIRRGQHKFLLRRLARKLVPRRAVERRKQGFAIPFDRWCGSELRRFLGDYLAGPDARSRQWLHAETVRELLEPFARGEAPAHLGRFQLYQRIFMLASFETWLRRWSPTP
jgi:asparagine synthase (glutamine-hydrolysing)